MTKTLMMILVVAGIAAAVLWGYARDVEWRQAIKDTEARVAARELVIAALAKQKSRVDTAAGKAVVVYRTKKGEYEALRDSLKRSAGDTTADPNLDLVEACDAALFAADSALSSCAQQVAVRDTLLAQKDTVLWAKDSIITLERKPKPFLIRFGKPAATFLSGFAAGLLLSR